MATSFQRLRKGIAVLDRYSGITGVLTDVVRAAPDYARIIIPVPPTVNIDQRDVAALQLAGWERRIDTWAFTP